MVPDVTSYITKQLFAKGTSALYLARVTYHISKIARTEKIAKQTE
jgi:hypothetical protein